MSKCVAGKEWHTYNNQMTLEPVLQPLRVTMWPRMDSYRSARWSLSACKHDLSEISLSRRLSTHVG